MVCMCFFHHKIVLINIFSLFSKSVSFSGVPCFRGGHSKVPVLKSEIPEKRMRRHDGESQCFVKKKRVESR